MLNDSCFFRQPSSIDYSPGSSTASSFSSSSSSRVPSSAPSAFFPQTQEGEGLPASGQEEVVVQEEAAAEDGEALVAAGGQAQVEVEVV